MNKCFAVLLLLLATAVHAQYQVTLKVNALPAYHKSDDAIFVAGSFNNWYPGSAQYQLKKDAAGTYGIVLSLPAGVQEFKLTRGTWQKGESNGREGRPNRVFQVTKDTTLSFTVKDWADHFATTKKTTASPNVHIHSTTFFIPQLNRHRRVWVYLPQGYGASRRRYPVLYVHDGQNIFEDTTAYAGEWGIDEALDSIAEPERQMIVVAVDNGGETRNNEYSPFDMERFGKGEGNAYADFLETTLRRYIDKTFRTQKRTRSNYIAGSSMGGLISFWAILRHPRKWGGAGVFSPAFWVVPALEKSVIAKAPKVKGKIYFFAGKSEGERVVPDMLTIFNQMAKRSKAKLTTVIRAEGKHNEATWRKEFPLFYQWILAH